MSSYSITDLQVLTTQGEFESLLGSASIAVFLESRLIGSKEELSVMDYTDQRNTLIAYLNEQADYDVSYLQGLADFDLVTSGLNSNAYSNRKIRAGSNGQSYWIVECLSASNGTTKFALYNHFADELPEEIDRLLCKRPAQPGG